MSKNDTVGFRMTLHARTSKAILVSDTGVENEAVWLPKSRIEYDEETAIGDNMDVKIPEWLAIDKCLIR